MNSTSFRGRVDAHRARKEALLLEELHRERKLMKVFTRYRDSIHRSQALAYGRTFDEDVRYSARERTRVRNQQEAEEEARIQELLTRSSTRADQPAPRGPAFRGTETETRLLARETDIRESVKRALNEEWESLSARVALSRSVRDPTEFRDSAPVAGADVERWRYKVAAEMAGHLHQMIAAEAKLHAAQAVVASVPSASVARDPSPSPSSSPTRRSQPAQVLSRLSQGVDTGTMDQEQVAALDAVQRRLLVDFAQSRR